MATAIEQKATSPRAKAEKPAEKEPWVLIDYNPGAREKGVYTESSFTLMILVGTEYKFQSVRPGIQRMSAKSWEAWKDSESPEITQALSDEVLYLVGESEDIREYTVPQARVIIRRTNDAALLQEWARMYRDLPETLIQALRLKEQSLANQESTRTAPAAPPLFGVSIG